MVISSYKPRHVIQHYLNVLDYAMLLCTSTRLCTNMCILNILNHATLAEELYMRSGRVYQPIYIFQNLFNGFIILQDIFLREHYVVYMLSRIWYYIYLPTFSVGSPAINQHAKNNTWFGRFNCWYL